MELARKISDKDFWLKWAVILLRLWDKLYMMKQAALRRAARPVFIRFFPYILRERERIPDL